MMARLLLPHEAKGIPICLQRNGGSKAILTFPQKPVAEGVQNVNKDAFKGDHRVLLGGMAVSSGVN